MIVWVILPTSFRRSCLLYFSKSKSSSESSGDVKTYASPDECRAAIAELRALLPGERVATDTRLLQTYGSSDNSYHPTAPHAVVVRPASTDDVVKIVGVARKYRMPVTAYAGATSLEGHFSGVCD